jgi:hypothetical protein
MFHYIFIKSRQYTYRKLARRSLNPQADSKATMAGLPTRASA